MLQEIELQATRISNGVNVFGINKIIKEIEKENKSMGEKYTDTNRISDTVFLALEELKTEDKEYKYQLTQDLIYVIHNYDSVKSLLKTKNK